MDPSLEQNNKNTAEEEYIPPGDRLITPPDVVEIDSEMTVFFRVLYNV